MDEAVKLILAENNTLFQSLTKNLNNYPELKAAIRSILMEGTKLSWNPDQKDIVQMQMYGLIRNEKGTVRIANRIFETMLYNLFLSDEELKAEGIDCLPGSLEEAIREAEKDPFIKETLGDHVYNNYIEGKKREWDEYKTQISQWEIDRYMINH
jgi:hypothetical protein